MNTPRTAAGRALLYDRYPPSESYIGRDSLLRAILAIEAEAAQSAALRAEFLRLLTQDSETKDGRRRDFNQAIFDATEGWAIWDRTDLSMVMEKFDKAARLLWPRNGRK